MKALRLFLFCFLAALLFPALSHGADQVAASCDSADVLTAINATGGTGTVTIPAGDCIWTSAITFTGSNLYIKGAGVDNTIIRLQGSADGFNHSEISFAEYSDFTIDAAKANRTGGTDLCTAIYLQDSANFRIHNVKITGYFHSMILMGKTVKGLIDNNYFSREDGGSSDYGISTRQENVLASDRALGLYLDGEGPGCGTFEECNAVWDNLWWNNAARHGGNAAYYNWVPDANEAVYIENNTIDWRGSIIMHNWSGIQGYVFRYNTVTNIDGNNGGIKYGNKFFEIYRNSFTNIGATCCEAIYLRANGLYHNNEFHNYSFKGAIHKWEPGRQGYNYRSTTVTSMHDSHFWGNTCPECTNYPSEPDRAEQYGDSTDGIPSVENVDFFFRAPQPGDRLYPYTEYTCPHPGTGLSGSCSTTVVGVAGYNVAGGTPSQTPVLHGATISPGVTLR